MDIEQIKENFNTCKQTFNHLKENLWPISNR